jgi:hypothetical protein
MKPNPLLCVFVSLVATACGDVARSPTAGASDASAPHVKTSDAAIDAAIDGSPALADLPTRILFICDVSGGVALVDPVPTSCGQATCLSRRAQAIVDTMEKYPPGDTVRYGLISFAATSSVLTADANGQSGFTTEKSQMMAALPALSATDGQASYDSALTIGFEILQADMGNIGTTSQGQVRYEIVFMAADLPTPDDMAPGESLPPEVNTDVLNIAGLQTTPQVALVSLNTVYLSGPNTPAADVFQASNLLQTMATLASGQFRQVNQNERVDLSYIDFTSNGGG